MPTTHTTPIDLRGFHGREFEGVVMYPSTAGIDIKGMLVVDKYKEVWLLNNTINIVAKHLDDYFGYSYAWKVQLDSEAVWNETRLKSITILDPPSSIDPRWDWKDGEIVEFGNALYKMNVFGRIVIPVHTERNMANGTMTFEQAYYNGYRKLPSPPTRKLTEITEEMFDKTNLIGRKVMYDEKEGQVLGMFIHPDESRSITIRGMVGSFIISQCKLIEE